MDDHDDDDDDDDDYRGIAGDSGCSHASKILQTWTQCRCFAEPFSSHSRPRKSTTPIEWSFAMRRTKPLELQRARAKTPRAQKMRGLSRHFSLNPQSFWPTAASFQSLWGIADCLRQSFLLYSERISGCYFGCWLFLRSFLPVFAPLDSVRLLRLFLSLILSCALACRSLVCA